MYKYTHVQKHINSHPIITVITAWLTNW
jgi:hypothetical protein